MRELNPSFDSTMEQNLHNLSDANEVFIRTLENIKNEVITKRPDGIDEIAVSNVEQFNPQSTILVELLRPYGFNSDPVTEILAGLNGESGRQYISQSHRLVKDRKTLQIIPLNNTDRRPDIDISEPFKRETLITLKTGKDTILCDAEKLKRPLTLRKWRDGDRFHPFGMKGSRLVSDYFSNLKLSIIEKQQQWLLCDADGNIVWVVGHRADGHFAITDKTEDVVRIKIVRGQ